MNNMRLLFVSWLIICPVPMFKCSENGKFLDKLLNATQVSSCVTATGEIGSCTKLTICEKYPETIVEGSEFTCPQDSVNEIQVCCPLSQIRNQKNSSKRKRDSDSSRPPNLRVRGCGVQKSLTDFIVGGKEATHWPWMVAIYMKNPNSSGNRFICGGTVISKHFVITAAHCMLRGDKVVLPNWITISIGSPDPSLGNMFAVSEVLVHENYDRVLHYDDIALLRTSDDMEVKGVVPACLPSPGMLNANFYKRNATVIGWGDVGFGISSSKLLKEAVVPIVSNKNCVRMYKKLSAFSLPRGIVDTHLCAGLNDGSADACQGDSGGPLLLEDKGGKWNVVGIVSFGYGCGHPDFPGVYTRVAKYLYWLRDNTDIPIRD